jgi:Ca-activated chloride channel family protein
MANEAAGHQQAREPPSPLGTTARVQLVGCSYDPDVAHAGNTLQKFHYGQTLDVLWLPWKTTVSPAGCSGTWRECGVRTKDCRIFLIVMLVLPVGSIAVQAQSESVAKPNSTTFGHVLERSAPAAPYDETSFTITKRVDEVRLVFTATNAHGRFVTRLGPDDLIVTDDNKPPAAIVGFGRETDMALDIGLVMDTSGSVRQRWTFEQEIAVAFLRRVLRPQQDRAFALGFSSKVQTAQGMTSDVAQLQTGLSRLAPGGGTALYDAIDAACLMQVHAPASVLRRHAIILITDGEDNQSRVAVEEAIEQAKRADVTIYAISTNDTNWTMRGDRVLQHLAVETGGRAFFPSKLKDLTRAFAQIEDELRSQYVIAYKPADFRSDGHYRTIQITARNPHVRMRSRSGYYSPTLESSSSLPVGPFGTNSLQ